MLSYYDFGRFQNTDISKSPMSPESPGKPILITFIAIQLSKGNLAMIVLLSTQLKESYLHDWYSFLSLCKINKEEHPWALIQPYDMPIGRLTAKEKKLELFRVHSKPRRSAEFVDAHSIIRGVLLVPTFAQDTDYYVCFWCPWCGHLYACMGVVERPGASRLILVVQHRNYLLLYTTFINNCCVDLESLAYVLTRRHVVHIDNKPIMTMFKFWTKSGKT